MLNSKIVDCELTTTPSQEEKRRELQRLQLDVRHDDFADVKLTLEFGDIFNCSSCEHGQQTNGGCGAACGHFYGADSMAPRSGSTDYELFLNKYDYIVRKSKKENGRVAACGCSGDDGDYVDEIETTKSSLLNTISNFIGCIGCRASIERFYNKLLASNFYNCLYPVRMKSNGNLALDISLFDDNLDLLYSFFYLTSLKFGMYANNLINNKSPTNGSNKLRRCLMHSFDKNRFKSINDWLPVWEAFRDSNIRSKFLLIDTDKFLVCLNNYLIKYRFCSDCKLKVIKAFNLLIGELDSTKEKSYNATLYEGIECCTKTNLNKNEPHLNSKHLHLKNDKKFIANLISKAELELQGSRRERHAKTLDVAQEEVLTCIGIYLYDKFYRFYQLIKLEEQNWHLLFFASLVTLRKSFEIKFENLQGISNLDLFYAELEQAEARRKKRTANKTNAKKNAKTSSKSNSNSNKKDNPLNNGKKISLASDEQDEDKQTTITDTDSHETDNQIKLTDSCPEDRTNDSACTSNDDTPSKACLCSYSSSSASTTSDSCAESPVINSSQKHNSCSSLLSHEYDVDESSFLNHLYNTQMSLNHSLSFHDMCIANDEDDNLLLITDEEKNEYYANKTNYLNERLHRREILKQKFLDLRLNASFKLRPRNVS